jgi:hypothetical protein
MDNEPRLYGKENQRNSHTIHGFFLCILPDTFAVTMPAGPNQKRQSFSIYPRSLS